MIKADLVAQARNVSLVAVLDRCAVRLKKQGNELVGPCPRCGGTDRFAVHLKKRVFNCRGCGGKGSGPIDLAIFVSGCTFAKAIEILTCEQPQPPDPTPKADDEGGRIRKARAVWRRHQPIEGSLAEAYLRDARGYQGPLPVTLGYLPPTKPDHHPALIAACGGIADEPEPGVVAIAESSIRAVHLILLKIDGSGKADAKPNKISIGSIKGSPVVLASMNDPLGLAITEGIEDGLSIYAATGLGVWASGSAPMMPALADVVPEYADAITIVVDNDADGRRYAEALASGLRKRGIHVEPIILGKFA
jgi:Toprim domain/CHC2 zinc finger